jgi:hypothetical protein
MLPLKSPEEDRMGKAKVREGPTVPAFKITAEGARLDEVHLQVDHIVPAATAFEIVKMLAGAAIDRARDVKPRPVSQ